MRGELLESAQVHGNDYGTPAEPVRQAMAEGMLRAAGDRCPGRSAGSEESSRCPADLRPAAQPRDLGEPPAARGTDDEPTIERRLAGARRELELAASYDVHVINDDLDRAVDDLAAILTRNGCGARSDHD